MAFTAAVTQRISLGNKYMVTGTYVNDGGSTGGDITVSGLNTIEEFFLQPKAAAVIATQSVFNETLPLAASTPVTIVTSANESGRWAAIGF